MYTPLVVHSTDMPAPSLVRRLDSLLASAVVVGTDGTHKFQTGALVYTPVSLIALIILSALLTIRFKQFHASPVKALNVLRFITISIYATAILMIFTLAMMYNGIGLSATYATCRSSIIICFVWYGLNRAGWIFFFIERAHNIRSSEVERRRDWIWIIGFIYTCVLCLILFILAMVYSYATFVNNVDGGDTCQLGIPRRWLIAVIIIGAINIIWILILYLWLLKPTIRHRVILQEDDGPASIESSPRQFVGMKSGTNMDDGDSSALPTLITHEKPAVLRLENLIKKSIYGLLLMMPVEVFNFAYFLVMDGMEMGWICFLICTFDVLASVFVIHWLTTSPKDTQRH